MTLYIQLSADLIILDTLLRSSSVGAIEDQTLSDAIANGQAKVRGPSRKVQWLWFEHRVAL
jgi:hypothetical protein